MERDYYDILGVDKEATEGQIREAYIRLARENSPYRNLTGFREANPNATGEELDTFIAKEGQTLLELNEAYEVLSDKDKRDAYDKDLETVSSVKTGKKTRDELLDVLLTIAEENAARKARIDEILANLEKDLGLSSEQNVEPHVSEMSTALGNRVVIDSNYVETAFKFKLYEMLRMYDVDVPEKAVDIQIDPNHKPAFNAALLLVGKSSGLKEVVDVSDIELRKQASIYGHAMGLGSHYQWRFMREALGQESFTGYNPEMEFASALLGALVEFGISFGPEKLDVLTDTRNRKAFNAAKILVRETTTDEPKLEKNYLSHFAHMYAQEMGLEPRTMGYKPPGR